MTPHPIFYYDFANPEAYLAAERSIATLPIVPEWQPVRAAELAGGELAAQLHNPADHQAYKQQIEARARELELQPVRWPAQWPVESELGLRVAAYAKSIGKVVAFSLAAFRQTYAGGQDLSDPDVVCIAAAACEMHPRAVLKSIERAAIAEKVTALTAGAIRAGVTSVPAVQVGEVVFHGERVLEQAAQACK